MSDNVTIGSWTYSNEKLTFFPSNEDLQEITVNPSKGVSHLKDKLFGSDVGSVTFTNVIDNKINVHDVSIKIINKTSDTGITSSTFFYIIYYFLDLFMQFKPYQKQTDWKENSIVIEGYHQFYLIKNNTDSYHGDVWKYIDLSTNEEGYYKSLEPRTYIHPYITWIYLISRCILATLNRKMYKTPYVVPTFVGIPFINLKTWRKTANTYKQEGKNEAVRYLINNMKKDKEFTKVINNVKENLCLGFKDDIDHNKVMKVLLEPITLITRKFKKYSVDNPDSIVAFIDKLGLLEEDSIHDIVESNFEDFFSQKPK